MPLPARSGVLLAFMLSPLVSLCAREETTPLALPIKEGAETRIACEHKPEFGVSNYPGVYHYRVWLPRGYLADTKKTWKSLFIASPGGKATMGNMEAWLKSHPYVVIMLEESKNGPWDPSVGNFLAAHDDATKRFRLTEYGKVCTGFSGGSRASSLFVTLTSGFGGVILQGATTGVLDNGMRGLKGVQIPAVVLTMGKKDANRGEIKDLQTLLDGRVEVMEFEGGHMWAPKPVIEKALDYVDARLPK